ncbi:MAG: diphosphomevalonate decarboxylase [Nanoarchaeota archaeon]|nr:diphosphomevalonate decarboxylase [Nanoarchaeota archaeon]
MKATAVANSNIALTKYWGKRDSKLMLPQNGSISMTLDGLNTTTTVEFNPTYENDIVILNDQELTDEKDVGEIIKHLDLIREMAGITERVKVVSKNNFPTAAGLASSASGFAALSFAASKAAGLDFDKKELSMLSRRGSGSASRSIEGGFVEWHRGEREDGTDSFAEQIAPKDHWDFRMVTTIVSIEEKKVKSRAGMAQTLKTCPYYDKWLATVNEDINTVREGIKEKNFTKVGETAEFNSLKMHATMITTKPSIIYWNPATMEIMHAIQAWREEDLESYFTMDAGPNVKVMCMAKDADELKSRLEQLPGVKQAIICKPGDAAKLVDEHLF